MRRVRWLLIAAIMVGASSVRVNADSSDSDSKAPQWMKSLAQSPAPNSEPATVAGVRGLEDSATTGDTSARDFAAIERLKKDTVSEIELKQFIAEGKLR